MNKFYSFLFLILCSTVSFSQSYKISFQVNGYTDSILILGNHFAGSMQAFDTAYVDNKGKGVFEGKKEIPQGVYFLYQPVGKLLDIIIDDDQQFEIFTDTSFLLPNTKFKGSEINTKFANYRLRINEFQEKGEALMAEKNDSNRIVNQDSIDNLITKHREKYNTYVKQVIEKNKNNFLGVLLTSLESVEIPDAPRDEQGNITDSSFQFRYYKNHYFDNYPLDDPRLLRTPMHRKKIMNYIENFTYSGIDTLKTVLDFLIEQARPNNETFQYMVATTFNYYAKSDIMGMDAMFVYIADKYLIPDGFWLDSAKKADMRQKMDKVRPLLIGEVAPNTEFMFIPDELLKASATDTAIMNNPHIGSRFRIHQVKSKYTAVYFWSSDCGSCKKSIPKLHKVFEEMPEQLQVIAVHLDREKEKWTNFINEHQLYGWINAWSPYSNQFRDDFNIQKTNDLYLLDEDKKIIAKMISPEQMKEIIGMRESGK